MCDYEDLIYDEACLVINKPDSSEAWLYSLSSDCNLCPFTRIHKIIKNAENQSLKFNTASSLVLRIKSDGVDEFLPASDKSGVICEFMPNLEQFGVYELNINNASCDVNVVKNPSSLYTPLLVVFAAIICALGGCSLIKTGLKKLRKKLKPDQNENGDNTTQGKSPAAKRRVNSIDTFRGISILMMIFVNDGAGGYSILEHATWDGLLIGDFVFPWFMWIMGVCLPISVGSQLSRKVPRFTICVGIVKRSVILFLLGISLNTLGTDAQLESIRIFGVLQRFSVVYLVVALILALLSRRKRIEPKNPFLEIISDILVLLPEWLFILCIVGAHCAVTFRLPIPGCQTGYLGPGGQHEDGKHVECIGGAAGYIDRLLLGSEHIYQFPTAKAVYGSGAFDPEGILGCLSSIFQVFLGVQGGMILRYYKNWKSRVCRWIAWSIICGSLGLSLHFTHIVPINKNLWSMSYVLVTTSSAFVLLTICYILVDVTKYWRGGPFRIPGTNALAMYVGHQLCYQIFPFHWKYGSMKTHTLQLIEALWGVGVWTIIAYLLHRKKIYLSI